MIDRAGPCLLFVLAGVAMTSPAAAQQFRGGVAVSVAGEAGRRQTRDQATPSIKPLNRVEGRINNRIQSRIRNRIDRFYDPQANALLPFVVAGERARDGQANRR